MFTPSHLHGLAEGLHAVWDSDPEDGHLYAEKSIVLTDRAAEALLAIIQGLLLQEKNKQSEREQCLVLLSTKRACRVRGGLLPGCSPGGTRPVCKPSTSGCGRMQCSPRSPGRWRSGCRLLKLSLLSVEGSAQSSRTWGKMEGMGTLRSDGWKAEDCEGAPGPVSGSGRLLGAVAVGSSLAWLLLTALTCSAQRTG